MAVNLIRKNNSDAVTAAMDAAMYYMMLGEGIFYGTYSSCAVSITNDMLTIQPGVISLGGRILEIPENSSVRLALDQYGKGVTIYIKANITIEDDDSNSKVTIYTSTDSSESDRHALTGACVYTTNLFIVKYNINQGAYTKTTPIGFLNPGIAKNATNIGTDGRIGGETVSNLFALGTDGKVTKVLKTKLAEEAEIADGLAYVDDGTGNNLNKVTENLYMPYRGAYLALDTILTGEFKVSVQDMKTADTSVEIDDDPASITIPFDIGASLKDTTMSCFLLYLNIGNAPQWMPGNYVEKGNSFFLNDDSNTTIAELMVLDKNKPITSQAQYKDVKSGKNTSLGRIRLRFFEKPKSDFTFFLHALTFGGEQA